MKKLFLILSIAGMVLALCMPASAADVKFFGDYYVIGQWASNHSLANDASGVNNQSRGTVGQRLRINTVYQIAEGLKLTTRFDAMEKAWGQDAGLGTPNPTSGTGSNAENNIAWERAFVTFNLGPGFFDAGYQAQGYWSPVVFGNTTGSGAVLRYTVPIGPLTLGAYWEKIKETQFDPSVYKPADWNRYALQAVYKWKSGQAGVQGTWETYESKGTETYNLIWTPVAVGFPGKLNLYEISPFVQAKLGPVDLEGKAYWTTGEIERKSGGNDLDLEGLSLYLNGKVNIGPAYAGAMFAYIKGDDPNDGDVTASHAGGQDWDPCLMLGNDRYNKWMGGRYTSPLGYAAPGGAGTTAGTNPGNPFYGGFMERNVWIYQGYLGFKPIPKLALKASFTYMKADESPVNGAGVAYEDHIGNEFDITASYKIYSNLEYLIGFGYLWTGDYFKGGTTTEVSNNYLLMHQLTLTF